LLLHFEDKLNFAEIGRLEGISRMVANRKVKEAVEKLKKFFEKI
jgi:DNA-directed RNA polymerase specialized sigma subunit